MFFEQANKMSFMDAVRRNNLDAVRAADISKVSLDDFKTAIKLLEDNNPDWSIRLNTDLTKATIIGVQKTIERMERATVSPGC